MFKWFSFSTRFEQASVKTSEFTDEMDEMFFWIHETENIITTPLQPEEAMLEDLLERMRVSMATIASVCTKLQEIWAAVNSKQ